MNDIDGPISIFTATRKGKNMENQITCPSCKRTITNNPVIGSAAKGEDHTMGSEYVICECGERISFLVHYSPAKRSAKAGWQNPELVPQLLQGLIPE